MLSASALALQSLGMASLNLPPAPTQCSCSLCGTSIFIGDPLGRYDTKAYGGLPHLAADQAPHACPSCSTVLATSDFMTTYSRAVFTESCTHRMTQANDIAWMLCHATAPFVAVFNTRKSAHVLCHAPVTLDRRHTAIVLGSVIATIRPERVLAARTALARLSDVANAALNANYIWCVDGLSLRDDSFCEFLPSHEQYLRQNTTPQIQQDLEVFDGLNLAERWGLSALLLAAPQRTHALQFPPPPTLSPPKAKIKKPASTATPHQRTKP